VTRKLTISFVEEVNRVILWATVTTKKDQFVTGLEKEDFRVFEQGVEQEVVEFYAEDRPISLALLLDSSGSMKETIKELHLAAGAFVETLTDQDRALVIDFDDSVFLLQELTSDKAALREAVSSTEPLGGTAIHDALHAAYRKLRGLDGRKAIILISDGEDTHSRTPYPRVLEEAKSEGILVYTIGLGPGTKRSALKDLADATGGRSFFVGKAEELTETYKAIADELRKQYYVTYSSRNTVFDGRYIEIRVAMRNPDWDVRSRRGYFAVRAGENVKQARDAAKEKKKEEKREEKKN
jgi:VWFA-related protein